MLSGISCFGDSVSDVLPQYHAKIIANVLLVHQSDYLWRQEVTLVKVPRLA